MQQYLTHFENIDEIIKHYFLPFSFKIIGAFAIWIIGGFLVRTVLKLMDAGLRRRQVDPTLVNYASHTSNFILKAFLVLSILGTFGLETTSFSALLAATGVAIGIAWSGLLSNFAAGVFLIILRPFKVGDTITAAGVTGVVREIGLFATSIDNGDNLRVFLGNNKVFSDNIMNYSANSFRALSFKIQLVPAINPLNAIEEFSKKLKALPNLKSPVTGDITEFNPMGVVITMRSTCAHADYQNLLTAGNQIVYVTMQDQHYPTPNVSAVMVSR